MSEAVIEKEEAAPVETPVTGLPASSVDDRSIDDLLEEFERTTQPKPAEAEPVAHTNAPGAGNDDLDAILRDFSAPSADQQRADALQGEIDSLRAAEYRRAELEAFDKYASDLQAQVAQVAAHVPPDYVRAKLEALAHDPEVRLAWDTRHIDPQAANRDLAEVQFSLKQLQADPNADPKQVRELNKLAYQLNVAVHSHSILRRVNLNVLKEARSLPLPYDPEASADRAAVAFAVREASSGDLPEPQVDLGKLSDVEFRKHLRDKYNISGF